MASIDIKGSHLCIIVSYTYNNDSLLCCFKINIITILDTVAVFSEDDVAYV